jgi:NTP pyrophosphatase (non-canonical NTP hydrolase)
MPGMGVAWFRAGSGGGLRPQSGMAQNISSLTQALRDFAAARNWEPFHSPKNLAAALSVEAAELLEHFQWLTEEQSRNLAEAAKAEVAAEAADVLLYLLQLCDKLDIDLLDAARRKMAVNAVKYPAPPVG